jgi:hypothetical protein
MPGGIWGSNQMGRGPAGQRGLSSGWSGRTSAARLLREEAGQAPRRLLPPLSHTVRWLQTKALRLI